MSRKGGGHADGPLSHCHVDGDARHEPAHPADAAAEGSLGGAGAGDPEERGHEHEGEDAHEREHPHEAGPGHDHPHEHEEHDHDDGEHARGGHEAPGHAHARASEREQGHGHGHGQAGHSHGGLSHRGAHVHGAGRDPLNEQRRLGIALAITATILFAEIAGGLYSGSLALLSDAGHMLTDASAIFIALLASRIALRRADPRRTYGYYRYEILAALLNGALLMVLAGYIGWEAWHRVLAPPPVKTAPMVLVALAGLLANGLGLFLLRGRSGSGSLNLRAAYLHLLSDTLSSVAVVLGGLAMWVFKGAWVIDPILSVLIAVLILVSGFRLLREAVDILLEAAPQNVDCAEVARAMSAVPGVARVHDLHVWSITSGMYALSAHLVVEDAARATNNEILGEIRELLCERFHIDHTTIQLETEGYRHLGKAHRSPAARGSRPG